MQLIGGEIEMDLSESLKSSYLMSYLAHFHIIREELPIFASYSFPDVVLIISSKARKF